MAQQLIVTADGKTATKYVGSVFYSKDVQDVRGIADFRMIYSVDRWSYWVPGLDKVALVGGVIGNDRLFYGHVTRVTRNEEYMNVALEDMGYKMKATYSGSFTDKTIKDAITSLCTEIGFKVVFDNIPQKILSTKVSSSTTTETAVSSIVDTATSTVASTVGTTVGVTICADGKPSCWANCCSGSYTTVHSCFINYCPNCKKTGLLQAPVSYKTCSENQLTCNKYNGGCDSDYCVACGREKITGSTSQLTKISGGCGTSGTSTGSTTSTTPNTYEDQINQICAANNLYMCIDNYENCIIKSFTGTPEAEYTITPAMIKKDTYSYSNGQTNTIKEVKVTYKNGTVTKSIADTSDITDKNIQTYSKTDLNQVDATTFAETALNQILREQDLEISAEVFTSPDCRPGVWVSTPKPTDLTTNETLYVSGLVVNVEGGQIFNSNITMRYAPPMPDISSSSSSSTSTTSTASIDAIGKLEATFRDCQPDVCGSQTSQPDANDKYGYSDCWGDSYWLYNKLKAISVQVRIIGCSSSQHRWIEINTNGSWQVWNYTGYGSQHYGKICSGSTYVYKS